MIDHEAEVKKIYPDAFLQQAYNKHCDYLPIGVFVCRYKIVFGMSFPFFPIKIGGGWIVHLAWQSAYNELVSQGLITPQT